MEWKHGQKDGNAAETTGEFPRRAERLLVECGRLLVFNSSRLFTDADREKIIIKKKPAAVWRCDNWSSGSEVMTHETIENTSHIYTNLRRDSLKDECVTLRPFSLCSSVAVVASLLPKIAAGSLTFVVDELVNWTPMYPAASVIDRCFHLAVCYSNHPLLIYCCSTQHWPYPPVIIVPFLGWRSSLRSVDSPPFKYN